MCSTCCALGAVGMYCVQQFVFVTVVANRQCGGIGVEGRTILRRTFKSNGSKWFGLHQDGISDTAQNGNRPLISPEKTQL